MADLVLLSTHDRTRVLTLNRPEARNALNRALQREAGAALLAAEADDTVDVVVLTGADPAFCAGLDLRELGRDGGNLVGGADEPERSPFAALWTMTKPVIGAINGPCVTGGFELALACDFLVASERATFGDTHARVGVLPAGGMSVFLPMAVGLRRAKEMSLTGNFIDAHEALRLGLVNHVVPHEQVVDRRWLSRATSPATTSPPSASCASSTTRTRESPCARRSTRSRRTSAGGASIPPRSSAAGAASWRAGGASSHDSAHERAHMSEPT